jgi:hypothetical protein
MNKKLNKNLNKKAQMQMFESISVIIVLTVLILFGIVFYSKMQKQSIQEDTRSQTALSAVELSQRMASLPELSCSAATVRDASCIDVYKAYAFQGIMKDPVAYDYYNYLFGNARIELSIIYTGTTEIDFPTEMLLYENNATNAKEGSYLQNAIPVRIPFSVYNPVTQETYLGVLNVISYASG